MGSRTALILGSALVIGVLVYVLTRAPKKAVGSAPSTSNDIFGGITGLANAVGGLVKLIPRSASGNNSPGPGQGGSYDQSQPNNPNLDYAPFYPGNDTSGTGITDGGT